MAQVEVVGAGAELVFVGAAAPMLWTRPAALALARAGFRVTNFDYGSRAEEPLPRTALDQSLDVAAVMAATGVHRGCHRRAQQGGHHRLRSRGSQPRQGFWSGSRLPGGWIR